MGSANHRIAVPSMQLNRDIQAYVDETRRAANGDSWTGKPELPTSNEILGIEDGVEYDEPIDLVPNKVDGRWESAETYLKAHYDLLREDAVSPLRDAVAYVKQDPKMMDSPDVCIYEKVHIIGLTCTDAGIAIRVQFSTARAGKNIVWEYSPRLTSGNIVALTPANDMFKTKCVIAVVAARPLAALKTTPPEIDLFYARAEDAEFDHQQEWVMVEARSGYFEASRHTLTALQKMGRQGFPFSEYLCGLQPNIEPPEYLQSNPFVDFSSTLPDQEGPQKIDALNNWPSPPESLDSSQWDALRQILTKKLAIVQGPPGTGKTHVSVVALRTLLSTMSASDPPIILAAQTNHALDQLLTHVAKFEMNYVRLGGRSTDEDIKKRTLHEVKKLQRVPNMPGGLSGRARKQLKALTESLIELFTPFNLDNAKSLLPASLLLKMDAISQSQHDSLVKGAEGWVQGGGQADPVSIWIGEQKTKFAVVYKANNFGFNEDEIDLEYEQLKELELEQGVDEEEYETLRGPYLPIGEEVQGRWSAPTEKHPTLERYLKFDDLWKIPATFRGGIYKILHRRAKQNILKSFRSLAKQYEKVALDLKTGRWELASAILEPVRVVGMTTTGLSKYRALVAGIKPKIILIEEAAEVIEAPVMAACVKSLEHLILVGDHKQLQGQCAVKDLEGEPYFLNVSMFERLVHNGIEFKTLTKQRRMAPEIRRVLAPIYDNLEDHPSVLNREGVPGMANVNSFFFCHPWPESSDSLLSKCNEGEARMVVGFFIYLHMNGVPVKDITVLTFYNGQRKKILKRLKETPLLQGQYLKVCTVDSYQGEENEIVILSLVRSHERGNIGFLAVENRVCVALSRAKRGFYIFGNAESLAVSSPLWWEVVQIMARTPKRLGYHVPLTCSNHRTKTYIYDAEQWESISGGGCDRKCDQNLGCGHPCPLHCHVIQHVQIRCQQSCTRTLPCGHPCINICSESCDCQYEDCPAVDMALIVAENEPPGAEFPPRTPVRQRRPVNSITHAQLVRGYQNYADGGAQQDDARLAAEAELLSMNEQPITRNTGESLIDLLNEDMTVPSVDQTPSKPKEEEVTVQRTPDGRPVRRKFVQYYSSSPRPYTKGGRNGHDSSLI
ncbi:hypothetical protein FQN52_006102 [Onygenales sp. PD_12]|nr:hypothetical protein FQN52_006102 [Onygenales sp. PD_12]